MKTAKVYLCLPKTTKHGFLLTRSRAFVPTPTLRGTLGEGLQTQDDFHKLDFFRALSQFDETRQVANYSYFSAARRINCRWLQGSKFDGVASIRGTATILGAH